MEQWSFEINEQKIWNLAIIIQIKINLIKNIVV